MSRFQPPPASTGTELGRYLQLIVNHLNDLPVFSQFSASTPEGTITAGLGTIGINLSSTGSHLWLKNSSSGATGWIAVA